MMLMSVSMLPGVNDVVNVNISWGRGWAEGGGGAGPVDDDASGNITPLGGWGEGWYFS